MQWVDNSAGSMYLGLIWGSGQLLIVSTFLGKYRSPKYYYIALVGIWFGLFGFVAYQPL